MKVAVLGCGLIGASWAALFAARGRHSVFAWDPSEAARREFPARVDKARRQLLALGAGDGGSVEVCHSIGEALTGAHWAQENAPEDLALKERLYKQIEEYLPPTSILASSTSSFTWSQLSGALRNRARFVIAHPFNPPHLVPLVELFGPDPDVLARAGQFFQLLDRVPVALKREATGHIGNRLAAALWREAVHIVAAGIADVSDVDKVLIHGPGLRWSIVGTHLGYHLGGGAGGIDYYLQHLGPSQERRWETLGNPKLTADVVEKIARGVHDEVGTRSIAQLEADRDRQLMAVLRLRHAIPTIDLPANGKTGMNSKLEIGALVEDYLKGLYTGDTALLRTLFHPQASLFGDIRGAAHQNTLDGWLAALEQRQSPRELGEEFRMEMLGIEVINEIAYARCRCPMLGFNYMDYLSLLRQGGRWIITNKLFTHVAEGAA